MSGWDATTIYTFQPDGTPLHQLLSLIALRPLKPMKTLIAFE
jgi:hypothetical protein